MDDDSYLGYSVAAGDFTGEGRQGAAVGMPRGASLLGKVYNFKKYSIYKSKYTRNSIPSLRNVN